MKRSSWFAAASMLVVDVLVLRPILFSPGIPAMRHDWAWPLTRGGVSAAMLGLSAPVVSANWNAPGWLPRLDVVQPLVLAANLVAPPAVTIKLLLFAFALAASIGAYRLARAFGARVEIALLASLWYTASPFFLVQLVAGHLWLLAGYAALPNAVEALVLRRPWYASFFWIATTAIDVHFLGFDLIVMLALAAARVVSLRDQGGAFLGLVAFLPSLTGVAFAASGGAISFEGQHAAHLYAVNNSTPWLDALRGTGYFTHYDTLGQLGPATWLLFAPLAAAVYALAKRRVLPVLLMLCGFLPAAGLYGPLATPIAALFEHVGAASLYRELYDFIAIYDLGAVAAIASIDVPAPAAALGVVVSALALWPALGGTYGALLPGLSVPRGDLASVESFEGTPGTSMLLALPAQPPIAVEGFEGGLDPLGIAVGSHGLIEGSRGLPAPARAVLALPQAQRDARLARLHVGAVLDRAGWQSLALARMEPGFEVHAPPPRLAAPGAWSITMLESAPALRLSDAPTMCASGDPNAYLDRDAVFASQDERCGGTRLAVTSSEFVHPADAWVDYDPIWFLAPQAAAALPGAKITLRKGLSYPLPANCDRSASYVYAAFAMGSRGWTLVQPEMTGCDAPVTRGPTVLFGVSATRAPAQALDGRGTLENGLDRSWIATASGTGEGRSLLVSASAYSPYWALWTAGGARVLAHRVANGYFNAWEIDVDGPFSVTAIYWPALVVDAALVLVAALYAASLLSWSKVWKQR